jgi:putative transposase
VERGETPGFPRFKPTNRFDSLEWEDHFGWKLKTQLQRLYLKGIGEIRTNFHRPFTGEPKAITVKREGSRWWLSVRCVDVPAIPLARTCSEIGIDLGVANQIATSDGELKKGKHFGARAQRNLARAQRELATKQRGSNRRRRQVEVVVRLHHKIKNQRSDAAHQLSRQLINDYDFIALEDLKITNMVRAPKGRPDPGQPGAFLPNGASKKAGLNRSIHDAGWGQAESQC